VKRLVTFSGGLILGAFLFGALGIFVGYQIAQGGKPALVLHNLTDAEVAQITVHSDAGDSRSIDRLPPKASRRVKLSGRDQALWITGTTTAGRALESEHVYVTSGTLVFGAISENAIMLDCEL
jgi:xanthosine utilization system XapX-like protein